LAVGLVARRLWTSSPFHSSLLADGQNAQRRGHGIVEGTP
jgi:hypothetical protein